jgi:hypothetical protein
MGHGPAPSHVGAVAISARHAGSVTSPSAGPSGSQRPPSSGVPRSSRAASLGTSPAGPSNAGPSPAGASNAGASATSGCGRSCATPVSVAPSAVVSGPASPAVTVLPPQPTITSAAPSVGTTRHSGAGRRPIRFPYEACSFAMGGLGATAMPGWPRRGWGRCAQPGYSLGLGWPPKGPPRRQRKRRICRDNRTDVPVARRLLIGKSWSQRPAGCSWR